MYNNPGYSSPSDVETSNNLTDYSETEAGYSSTTSTGFDYINAAGFQQMSGTPSYAAQRYSTSQSPPQLFGSVPTTGASAGTTSSTSPPPSAGGGNAQQSSQTYQRIARFVGPPPVALACTECRSRHLKCDAGTPVCSRCLTDKRECSYVKSRRGWKGTRRKKVAAATTAQSGTQQAAQSENEGSEATTSTGEHFRMNPGRSVFAFLVGLSLSLQLKILVPSSRCCFPSQLLESCGPQRAQL